MRGSWIGFASGISLLAYSAHQWIFLFLCMLAEFLPAYKGCHNLYQTLKPEIVFCTAAGMIGPWIFCLRRSGWHRLPLAGASSWLLMSLCLILISDILKIQISINTMLQVWILSLLAAIVLIALDQFRNKPSTRRDKICRCVILCSLAGYFILFFVRMLDFVTPPTFAFIMATEILAQLFMFAGGVCLIWQQTPFNGGRTSPSGEIAHAD